MLINTPQGMSFFLVKHGKDQILILNSDCQMRILLDWIKKRCGLERGMVVDLADEEGNILDLIHKGDEYANQWIAATKLFLLVKVEVLPFGRKYETLFDLITENDRILHEVIQKQSMYDERGRSQSPKQERLLSVWKSASNSLGRKRKQNFLCFDLFQSAFLIRGIL